MRLINADTLKGMVVRENNLVMKRLTSAIDRVKKEEAIPVSWIKEWIASNPSVAGEVERMLEEYAGESQY